MFVLEILGWLFVWLLIGFVTQLAIRVVRSQEVFADGEHYFWSAVSGIFVLILWLTLPLVKKYLNLPKPEEE